MQISLLNLLLKVHQTESKWFSFTQGSITAFKVIQILCAQPSPTRHKSLRPAHGRTNRQLSYPSSTKFLSTVKALPNEHEHFLEHSEPCKKDSIDSQHNHFIPSSHIIITPYRTKDRRQTND